LRFPYSTLFSIPICSPKEDEAVYTAALDAIAEGLEQGDLLCIFPEGKLTQDGDMNEFRAGIERIIQRSPAPVIPLALQGLWGGFFSHSGPGVFKTPFHRIWSRIAVIGAQPVAPTELSAPVLREQILAMRGERR